MDVSTIHNFLEYLKVYQLKDLMLIMDRGFFSTGNILGLLDSSVGITFLQPLSFSLKKDSGSCPTQYNTDGRLFIKYITLIIYMQITKVMRNKKLFEKYSIRELLRELAKMKITYLENIDPIKSEISKKQKNILLAFNIKT